MNGLWHMSGLAQHLLGLCRLKDLSTRACATSGMCATSSSTRPIACRKILMVVIVVINVATIIVHVERTARAAAVWQVVTALVAQATLVGFDLATKLLVSSSRCRRRRIQL